MTTSSATIQASRELLDFFPQPERSTIANLFLQQVRAGCPPHGHSADAPWTADGVRLAVLVALTERLRRAFRHGWRDEYGRDGETIRILNAHQEAAIAFGQWAIEWEALPREERERRKRAQGDQYRTNYMDRQAPTEKQVEYLRRMGYDGPIDSKAFASSLIDCYTRGYKVVRRAA